MVRAESKLTVLLARDKNRVHVRVGAKTYKLSLPRAFLVAHEFMRSKHYEAASRVCEALVQSGALGPRAAILLARCRAGLKDYSACNELLRTALAAADIPTADALHTAFVYANLGMRSEAIRELARVAHDRPDLPTVCLLLGDVFATLGEKDQAGRCWRLAIQRDTRNGSVARAAQKGLSSLQNQLQSRSHNPYPTEKKPVERPKS